MRHNHLARSVLLGTAIVLLGGLPAMACSRGVPPRLSGETDEQWMARGRSVEQARFLAEADTVFLAELSMMKRVGASDVETTFTPVVHLAGDDVPTIPLTSRDHEGNTCRRPERVGDTVVVYAERTQAGYSIVGLVADLEIIDRGMIRTIRAAARGQLPNPYIPIRFYNPLRCPLATLR